MIPYRFLVGFLCLLLTSQALARSVTPPPGQFKAGSPGFFIKAGTPVSIYGLTLQPSGPLSLTNTTITTSASSVSALGGSSISRVYTLSPATSFSGILGIHYQAGELNGNAANALVLISDDGVSGFTALPNSATATNAVSGTLTTARILSKVSARELPPPPQVSLSNNGPLSCTATVTLTASTTGTVDSYTFTGPSGSVASVGSSATVTEAGTYTVTVSNAGGSNFATTTVTGSSGASAPTLTLNVISGWEVIQNTPAVSLSITGCSGGTVKWSGPNSTTGTSGTIAVPTQGVGALVYSATCTVGSCVSPPASATVNVGPSLVSGNWDGYVYGADCNTFRGWAWDKNKANTAISVEILDGPNVIQQMTAGDFRQDLIDNGKGNGKHAFTFTIPNYLKDGQSHSLSARVAGSNFILKNSPKALICSGGTTPPNKPPVAPTPTVLVAPVTAQVNVPFSGTLVAFTDPEGGTLAYGLTTLPAGLTFNATARVISGTPTEAGSFVLTYSATDPEGATNSVSFALTVNPASTTGVTGNFEGYLDKVECGTIRGWVWDRNKPNTPVTVEFYTGGTVWGSTIANIFRQDLKDAGKGNGAHAYSFEVPPVLKDGVTRAISARVQGSTYDLKWSGKTLWCPAPGRLSAEAISNLQATLLGNPVSDWIEVEVRGAEGQRLKLSLTDSQGRPISEKLIEKAGVIERQRFGISTQPSGLLLLRVSTADQSRTLKVLKP